MTPLSRLPVLGLALFASAALAHGGMEHLKGVIAKVEGTSITLTVEKRPPIVIQTDDKTEFSRGAAKATLKDVAVGQKVVIHATEHDEKYLAKVVKLAAAAPASDGGTPKPEHPHDKPH